MITKNDLIDLPAYTESGEYLGRVVDFELEPATHAIVRYHVRSRDSIKDLLKARELVVASTQVISLSNEKMVVDDGVILSPAIEEQVAKKAAMAT
jgi:sporulation protein YlmC with PRC-barrel domain